MSEFLCLWSIFNSFIVKRTITTNPKMPITGYTNLTILINPKRLNNELATSTKRTAALLEWIFSDIGNTRAIPHEISVESVAIKRKTMHTILVAFPADLQSSKNGMFALFSALVQSDKKIKIKRTQIIALERTALAVFFLQFFPISRRTGDAVSAFIETYKMIFKNRYGKTFKFGTDSATLFFAITMLGTTTKNAIKSGNKTAFNFRVDSSPKYSKIPVVQNKKMNKRLRPDAMHKLLAPAIIPVKIQKWQNK